MSYFLSRDHRCQVEAILFTNQESLTQIEKMLDRFPHFIEPCEKGFYLKTKSESVLVMPGQYVVTRWMGVVVKDADTFHERFKPIQIQRELF